MRVELGEKDTIARRRINKLLDRGSFMEVGEHVCARLTSFYQPDEVEESDGVVTGYGTIDGHLVYIFSQDRDRMGGTFGEMHGQKIVKLYEQAIKARAPIIGMVDCDGFRIEEGLDGLNKFAELYRAQAQASAVIPQVMVVVGTCGGGMSISASMADFIIVEKENGKLFVNPQSIVENTMGINEFKNDYSDVTLPSNDIPEAVRMLVDVIPASATAAADPIDTQDDLNRPCLEMNTKTGNGRAIVREISDNHFFFETKRGWGHDMVTGFIRINGYPIGVVANNTVKGEKRITAHGCEKAQTLIEICEKFHIPILTVTDTEGFNASEEDEKYLPRAAARMVSTLAFASVPKVNLMTGTIYGSVYSMMNSKGLGADYVFMWEDARANIVNPRSAVDFLFGKYDEKIAKEYEDTHSSAHALARHGYVDKVIRAEDTRKYLAGAFETFADMKYGVRE